MAVEPWLQDADVTLYHGDVLQVLRELPAESVDCCVTSPPYWGLRDYGQEGQLGLEPTPEEFVSKMVEVFREVRRVLASHGTVWLNLGDSYTANGSDYSRTRVGFNERAGRSVGAGKQAETALLHGNLDRSGHGLKPKDLVGIPWRVAFVLQADGWYLRSDIIWAKPNPMPESVTDRPTKAHEYVFLLSKNPRYFFDQEAVREAHHPDGRAVTRHPGPGEFSVQERSNGDRWPNAGRNIRSVWEIATQPYPEAHFATFPEELARRCIAAGCPEQVCRVCAKARERLIERGESDYARMKAQGVDWQTMREAAVGDGKGHDSNRAHIGGTRNAEGKAFSYTAAERTDVGWSDCGHDDYRPGLTLDPFIGSGTVAHVARKLGRHAVGIDLNESYLELAARRLQQQSLFSSVDG